MYRHRLWWWWWSSTFNRCMSDITTSHYAYNLCNSNWVYAWCTSSLSLHFLWLKDTLLLWIWFYLWWYGQIVTTWVTSFLLYDSDLVLFISNIIELYELRIIITNHTQCPSSHIFLNSLLDLGKSLFLCHEWSEKIPEEWKANKNS